MVSHAGLKQLRIAETEKYAHVTFFFNGGRETVFPGEERILVPSPKVATYDLQPEMSAPEVTDKVVEAIRSGRFDVIVLNYANTDMVGHSGLLDATIKAVETVDACLGRLAEAVEAMGGTLVITADHGNAEMMRDPETGEPHTAHTLNPVPFIVVNPPGAVARIENGRLADVAPTLLDILGLEKPAGDDRAFADRIGCRGVRPSEAFPRMPRAARGAARMALPVAVAAALTISTVPAARDAPGANTLGNSVLPALPEPPNGAATPELDRRASAGRGRR